VLGNPSRERALDLFDGVDGVVGQQAFRHQGVEQGFGTGDDSVQTDTGPLPGAGTTAGLPILSSAPVIVLEISRFTAKPLILLRWGVAIAAKA
jgi:hypothetical protein